MGKIYRNQHHEPLTLFQKIIIIIIVVIITLTLLFKTINVFSPIGAGYGFFTMLDYSLFKNPITNFKDLGKDFSNVQNLRKENEKLRMQLANSKAYKKAYENNEIELDTLAEQVKLPINHNYEKIYASITSNDNQNINSVITLDQGKNNGVSKNQIIINSDGVVGKVTKVFNNSCEALLLNSAKNDDGIAIKILNNGKAYLGMLKGYDQNKNLYKIDLYDIHAPIKVNDSVVTSGEGSLYPSGLAIGEVAKITNEYSSNGKSIYVKPSVNFANTRQVVILKGKK